MRGLNHTHISWLAAGLALLLVACSSSPAEPRAPRDRGADRDRGASEEPSQVEVPLVQEIERHRFSSNARDPFAAPGMVDTSDTSADRAYEPECDPSIEPLGFTQPSSLRLLGLITGTAVPRAMFLVGGSSTAVFVTEGARVGPECRSRITSIRDNEVVITPFGAEDDRDQVIIALSEEGVDADVSESN